MPGRRHSWSVALAIAGALGPPPDADPRPAPARPGGARDCAPAPPERAPADRPLVGTWFTRYPPDCGGWVSLRADGRVVWLDGADVWVGTWERTGPEEAVARVRIWAPPECAVPRDRQSGGWLLRLGPVPDDGRPYDLIRPPAGRVPPLIDARAWGACDLPPRARSTPPAGP